MEVVWLEEKPVWAMNYFGRIIEPGIIDGTVAGTIISVPRCHSSTNKAASSAAWSSIIRWGAKVDGLSEGDCTHFRGHEFILVDGQKAYELDYRGGLIRP